MKKILVMPVKNEEWIIEKTLSCASLWADHIIVADQNSTDNTREICAMFPKVKIIENKAEFHSSNVRKILLDAAREFDGFNAIFSFDADEVPTSHIFSFELDKVLKALAPGTAIEMQWLNLWRSCDKYRDDASVWSNSWKQFGFIDNRVMQYDNLNVINDHTSRVPSEATKNNSRLQFPKVLHYQFVDFERVMSKQAYNRIIEFVQRPRNFIESLKINLKYFPTKDEQDINLKEVPQEWVDVYSLNKINFCNLQKEALTWFDLASLKKIKIFGLREFSSIDIWDIPWEQKRQLAILQHSLNVPDYEIMDPRNILKKIYHNFGLGIIVKILWIKRLYEVLVN